MSQQHLDRLSAIDASFLHQESSSTHMHVGGIAIVEGPPPPHEEFLNGIRQRLHLVPRYRQRLMTSRTLGGRPRWIDDSTFDVAYHARRTALPKPGDEQQLTALVSRIFSQQLDRSKPLWELWLVEGLMKNRFALISKTHHALIDGVAGIDLAQVLFDLEPNPAPISHPHAPWQPESVEHSVDVVNAEITDAARFGQKVVGKLAGTLTTPERSVRQLRVAAEGVGELMWAAMNPAPQTPLNTEIGPHRRYMRVNTKLDDFKHIKNAFGTTINDVVLAVTSLALRRWLISRGVKTEGLELRALVPVSIRSDDEHDQLGNRIVAMRGPLPVYIESPVQTLRTVKVAMDGLKESKQAVGAEVLAGVQSFAPATILAQASRVNFSTRLFNLIVTNVPGPQIPLYVQGRKMLSVSPVAFLAKNHALSIAIVSYNGQLNFGLLADYDVLSDVETIAEGIQDAVIQLLEAAKVEKTVVK